MASNTVTTANSKKAKPLSSLTRLSPIVYLYRPSNASLKAPAVNNSKVAPPKVIFLGTWMGAAEAHIAKYLKGYQDLYPTAEIVLVRFELHHIADPSKIQRETAAVVDPIRAAINPKVSTPQVLVHLLSNGGSFSLHHVYEHFKTAHKTVFPLHTTFFDSSPAYFTYSGSVAAMTIMAKGWTRPLVVLIAHMLTIYYCLWFLPSLLFLKRDPMYKVWASHNDRTKVREVRRTYVYSEKDAIVDYKAVEKHAKIAREEGFEVTTEKFEGSEHVSHLRQDEDRYWRLVKENWEGVDEEGFHAMK